MSKDAAPAARTRSDPNMLGGGMFRFGIPLMKGSSEYDRLLVQDVEDLGGGPMSAAHSADAPPDKDGRGVVDQGLAEKILSKLFTTGGLVVSLVMVAAVLCLGFARGSHTADDTSFVTRFSEYLTQPRDAPHGGASSTGTLGGEKRAKRHHHSSLETEGDAGVHEKYAPRAAYMPLNDTGRAQRTMDEAYASDMVGKALAAALAGPGDAGAGHGGFSGKGGGERGSRKGAKAGADSGSGSRAGPSTSHIRRARKEKAGSKDTPEAPEVLVEGEGGIAAGEKARYGNGDEGAKRVKGVKDRVVKGKRLERVTATEMEHGATHQEALQQLEDSIRDTVHAAHKMKGRGASRRRERLQDI